MQSLKGKRIVVTRSAAQSADFCRQLSAQGAIPLSLPVISIQPLSPEPLRHALQNNRYDWLIFTSVNAVNCFFAIDPPSFAPAKIAVVGGATEEALATLGISADFIPTTFTGKTLASGLGNLQNQRVLLPRSKNGRPEITALLAKNGATVDDISLYETVRNDIFAQDLAAIQNADAVTFTSPSSVRNFLTLAAVPPSAIVACIGPTTANAARDAGLSVTVVPTKFTIPTLISALADYWQAEELSA